MANIDYLPENISEPKQVVDSIRRRRGGHLLNLDRMLLHSPPFARGWNYFLSVVRTELSIAPNLSELAICLVAVLNQAEYEFFQHAPEFRKAGGTEEQLAVLKSNQADLELQTCFNNLEQSIIQLTREMTCQVQVCPATLNKVRSQLDNDQQLTEIIGVIATYNMVSRYLVTLGVEPELIEK